MAIRGVTSARGMSVEEFKEWLKQFDVDGDGRISKGELREAIRRRGGWFTSLRASRAVRCADRDNSGYVDDAEIENLVAFAQKDLGLKISAW
jgi:calmodulin